MDLTSLSPSMAPRRSEGVLDCGLEYRQQSGKETQHLQRRNLETPAEPGDGMDITDGALWIPDT